MIRIVQLKPITVRRVMVWVAVVGVILTAWKMGTQRREYQQRAREHSESEVLHREHIERMAQLDPVYLKAGRLANLTALPIALRSDGAVSIARPNEDEGTLVVRACGNDVAPVAEVEPAVLRQFNDLAAASESEVEDFRARWIENAEKLADYHAQQRRKYERAASYPWLPIAPDQPPQ